tara:strand:- start:396 stop:1136 length:741 start_codon:yes stop_codon:yes gene_type:complete
MTITLYELAGAGDIRHSPYCWRTLMALKHKGFDDFERVPVYFRDRSPIAFSGQTNIPVLVDSERWINDSWGIACYLEDTYPDRPSLLGGDVGRAESYFVHAWVETLLGWKAGQPGYFEILVWDAFEHLDPADKDWWRRDREVLLGPLENYRDGKQQRADEFRPKLEPLRQTLLNQPFLCGNSPAYADYIVIGDFIWARMVSEFELIERDDPIHDWIERMLDLYDGLARAGVEAGAAWRRSNPSIQE